MNSFDSNWVDISKIYLRYCAIRAGNAYQEGSSCPDQDELQKLKFSRDELAELLKVVQKRVQKDQGFSIFDELRKLMSNSRLMKDVHDFSCFYDFVFFISRENGQKNITVNKAVTAWRLVLAGRFRLLNQWCDFVEKNQRYNISEDTWQQVLAFSRCVHGNFEGYDPEGAWPVLIDEFVEHMYRTSGSKNKCNCKSYDSGELESHPCAFEDPLPGLKVTPGLKRKFANLGLDEEMELCDSPEPNLSSNSKRNRLVDHKKSWVADNPPGGDSADDGMEITKQNSPVGCAVENCLSRGIAGLFSGGSYLQLDKERRVSYI
ncbi:unnamed protein product [Linum trigynum]|uniref:Defective in cullin neddylation protein n=1 Tax=Linum trigynum TaxID=586398 RepID=A0AAV2F3P9_9ROSI